MHENGAATRIRTGDPRITNALLYQLSYCGVTKKGGHSNPASQSTEGRLRRAQPTGVSILPKAMVIHQWGAAASGFGQNRRDHHAIDLRIWTHVVHGAAAVGEPCFFVERDRPWVSLPHAKPEMCAAKGSGDIVNGTHELLSDTFAVRWAVDVKAVQFDRSRREDTGWWIFALHLSEGYQ
jgi:hypothetical protein